MRAIVLLFLSIASLWAHGVSYELKKEGMAIRLTMGSNAPASYSPYKLYAPNASLPFQEGNTDKNGIVAFVPDRAGKWELKASLGSDHGAHPVSIAFEINELDEVVWMDEPLFARYGAIITGLSLMIGFFGSALAWREHRRRGQQA